MMILLSHLLFLFSASLFAHRRVLRYLQFFQQEEYDGKRFVEWLWRTKSFDIRGSSILGAILLCDYASRMTWHQSMFVAAGIALFIISLFETDPRRGGKLRLNMTERARRIYRLAFLLSGIFFGIALADQGFFGRSPNCAIWAMFLVAMQAIPFNLVCSNYLQLPSERKRQAHFIAEAKQILADTKPRIIGITGSYGKTSTKMVLNEMLSAMEPTFTLNRSINTPMGITREIRTRMKPGHRFAVIEMGAYQLGSIKRLCDLTPPDAAIITAVGIMHLERFGSEENVFRAKAELAQAVPKSGILVCNGDDQNARNIAAQNPKATTLLFGIDQSQHLDCWMTDIAHNESGASFVIHWKGALYPGTTKLQGRPMLSNILAAFTMACALGQDPRVMVAVAASLEPVENRLQVKRLSDMVELRDAYNSNPVGFAAALDELDRFPGGRKILVTPGMVELGNRQAIENEIVAVRAAGVCDLVLVVGNTNKDAIVKGLRKGGLSDENIQICQERQTAFAYIRKHHKPGDVVLIENDLPDLYEESAHF